MGTNMVAAHMKEPVIFVISCSLKEGIDDSETKKWLFVS